MNQIKSEYLRGDIVCVELYNDTYKILEKTNGKLWNTNIDHPIIVAKTRLGDYEESTTPIDLEELKKLDEMAKFNETKETPVIAKKEEANV